MNPKQQAVRLFDEIDEIAEYLLPKSIVKKLAIHEVDTIRYIKLLWHQKDTKELDFWQQVKKEIENL